MIPTHMECAGEVRRLCCCSLQMCLGFVGAAWGLCGGGIAAACSGVTVEVACSGVGAVWRWCGGTAAVCSGVEAVAWSRATYSRVGTAWRLSCSHVTVQLQAAHSSVKAAWGWRCCCVQHVKGGWGQRHSNVRLYGGCMEPAWRQHRGRVQLCGGSVRAAPEDLVI